MTPHCGELLNCQCHMSFFEGRIFLISCCSRNGVKLATLLYFAFLLTRHTHSNPLMSVSSVLYNNTVGMLSEDFFLTTFHGINWVVFFPIYKEAWSKAYTVDIIKAAFKVTGIFLLNPRLSVGVAVPQRKREQVVRVEIRLRAQFPELHTLRISPSR